MTIWKTYVIDSRASAPGHAGIALAGRGRPALH
jgi:hypothetical protein